MDEVWDAFIKWLLEEPGRIGGVITGAIVAIGAMIAPFINWPVKWRAVRARERVDDFNAITNSYKSQISERDDRIRFLEHERNNFEQRWISRQKAWDKIEAEYQERIDDLTRRLNPWPEIPEECAVIIVVEDDKMYATMLNRLLTRLRYKAFVVTSGQEALRNLRQYNQFKLMILDFGLPDLDGIQVAMQARREGFDIPIIGLSGSAPYLDFSNPHFNEVGFVAILPKTSRAAEIGRHVIAVLGVPEVRPSSRSSTTASC